MAGICWLSSWAFLAGVKSRDGIWGCRFKFPQTRSFSSSLILLIILIIIWLFMPCSMAWGIALKDRGKEEIVICWIGSGAEWCEAPCLCRNYMVSLVSSLALPLFFRIKSLPLLPVHSKLYFFCLISFPEGFVVHSRMVVEH